MLTNNIRSGKKDWENDINRNTKKVKNEEREDNVQDNNWRKGAE
jgi:hypothetical protein